MQHQVNLEHLTEAANVLMGPNGALQLAVVYATIERVAQRSAERGYNEGQQAGYQQGYNDALKQEADDTQAAADALYAYLENGAGAVTSSDEALLTLNESAHGDDHHGTHYDIYHGRFHRPGGDE